MTEQEKDLVQAQTIIWRARDLIGGTHAQKALNRKEKQLITNAWNYMDRVIFSIHKRIKIEEEAEKVNGKT